MVESKPPAAAVDPVHRFEESELNLMSNALIKERAEWKQI